MRLISKAVVGLAAAAVVVTPLAFGTVAQATDEVVAAGFRLGSSASTALPAPQTGNQPRANGGNSKPNCSRLKPKAWLYRCNLSGKNLSKKNLKGADLRRTNLSKANLS